MAGAVVALVAVLATLVWAVGFSPLLATRTVTVTGIPDADERRGVAAAAAIRMGTPLVRVDTAGAAARIGGISTVRSVTVARSWPSTVVITVRRRDAILAVQDPQGQLQVVDSDGVAFEKVRSLPPGVLQVNTGAAAPDTEGLRAAAGVLQALPPAQRARVTRVVVTSADLVSFTLGTVSVVWGGPGDGSKKLAVLTALLPTAPRVLDVSAPDTPVTR